VTLPPSPVDELVLFSFDDVAFPFQRGVKLVLHGYPRDGDDVAPHALHAGRPGDPDSESVAYYGTVIRVGDELWMYYLGNDTPGAGRHQRLLQARSTDGRTWTKPSLGVVEYRGSTDNNICDLPINGHLQAAVVLYEPDDPDPAKRFKLSYETEVLDKRMAVAFSADGITWVPFAGNPVGPYFFEQAGGTKFNGAYYVNGQGFAGHYAAAGFARQLVTHVSYDFETWTQEGSMGFSRDLRPPRSTEHGGVAGPQVHLGASLWNRGDVLVGFYGMWNGHPSNDRRLITMDLGLVVSHDALHYTEPVPDFPIVSARETKTVTEHSNFPQIMQGQGFENIGDETLFWYSPWPETDADAIRVASWPRDRLGHLEAIRGPEPAHVLSRPVSASPEAVLVLNHELSSAHASLHVELLTERLEPLPGYAAADSALTSVSALEGEVRWNGSAVLPDGPFRIRITFDGIRPEDARLYVAYLRAAA